MAKRKKPMDESEINHRLRKIKNYLGSFALDELNEIKIVLVPSFFVINLDHRQHGNGTHWIALAVYRKTLIICDSLGGLQPDESFSAELIQFLNPLLQQRKLEMTKRLQPLSSETCGYYCITFIREMSKTNNFIDFLSLFSSNLRANDLMIKFLNKR